MSEAVIFNIERGSLHDGPGVRTVVFIKGCTLRCYWCHNPEGISQKPQILRYSSRCIGCGRCSAVCPNGAISDSGAVFERARCIGCGRCASVCPSEAILLCGEQMTACEVFKAVLRDKRYYKPDGGVTLSGGECLTRPEFCADLLRSCRDAGIHTAIESALYVQWESVSAVLPFTDLFIADMKIAESARHREFTGASNERIKDNMRQLFEYAASNGSPKIWIRTPLIPGATDDADNLAAIKTFLKPWHDMIEKTELLEYNSLGEAKKEALAN
jgi:pyruvate formate lyase activating enzyme